jgi:hypothetical protein
VEKKRKEQIGYSDEELVEPHKVDHSETMARFHMKDELED